MDKEDKISEKLRSEYFIKQNKLKKVINNSFILKGKKSNNKVNQDIQEILRTSRMNMKIKEKLNKVEWYSMVNIFYNLTKNVELITSFIIQTNLLNFTHPLFNMKTRQQAFNHKEDISFMRKFKTDKTSRFKGIGYSNLYYFYSWFINFKILNVGNKYLYNKLNIESMPLRYFLLESFSDLVSLPVRVLLEIKRNLSIINTKNNYLGFLKTYKFIFLPVLIRDIIFRLNFNFMYFRICSEEKYNRRVMFHQKVMGILGGSLIGCLISNPLDVLITKVSTQQIGKYEGFTNSLKTIIEQEGLSRLFFSGFSTRSFFYIINSIGMFSLYNNLHPITSNFFRPEMIWDLFN